MFFSLIPLVVCAVIFWCFRRPKAKHPLPPEYPGALPFIGHTHMLVTSSRGLWLLLEKLSKFCVENGGVTCGQFGADIYYGIADPDDANTAANACLQKHFLYKVARPWLGQGLFTGSGPVWKHHRKVLSPAFSIPVVNGFFEVFNSQSRRMVSELEEHVGEGPFDHVMLMRDSILRISCRLWLLLEKLSKFCVENGGVTCGQFGADIYYGIADPDDANTAANACLQKHFLYKVARPWLGQGLFTGSGPVWKHHRKVLSPAFSIPVVNGFFEVFNSQSRRMVSELEEHVGEGPFDHVMLMRDSILRISCITAFGDTEDKDKDFVKNYVNAVDELIHVLMNRMNKIWYQSDLIYKLAGLKKRETELVNFLNHITDEVIERKIALLENGTDQTGSNVPNFRSFLDIVLELTTEGNFTKDEMTQELNTMVAAAFETTSQQLVFILTMMGSHPQVQKRIYEEVMEVIGGDRDVEKEDLPKLVYTEAAIKEVLRLLAVAPLLPRYIDKDVKLKNYTLRAGSQVFFMPHGLHRTKIWGDDPEEFRPERWFDNDKLPQMNKSFAAFSLGKRSCIGKVYAMVSMKIILAHLVRQLRWKADHTKMLLIIDVTLRSAGGHEIELERRISNNNYQGEKFYKRSSITDAMNEDKIKDLLR